MKTIALKYHLGILFILDNCAVFRLMMAAHCRNTCPNAERTFFVFQFKDSLVSVASQVIKAHSHLYGFLAERFFQILKWLFSQKGCMKKKNKNANKAKKVIVIAPTAPVTQLSSVRTVYCNIEFAAKLIP